MMSDAWFVETPLGIVRCPAGRWALILQKHPVLEGRQAVVRQTLSEPAEIRQSRFDAKVALYYRRDGPRWLCVVCNRSTGLLITAYPADRIKQGVALWTRSA